MARELAAIYAQIHNLALESHLLTFLDPQSINCLSVAVNITKLQQLSEQLLPLLTEQNSTETSCLTIELQHLLTNTLELLTKLQHLLLKKLPAKTHFSILHTISTCTLHQHFNLQYYGGSLQISLALINDVEILFKKLNCIFYCLPATHSITLLDHVITFLGSLRGTSPIPDIHLYLSSVSCTQCFQECAILPNQGQNLLSMLANKSCTHVCPPVKPEPVLGLCEREMKQLGITPVTIAQNKLSLHNEDEIQLHEASLELLSTHNIFQQASNTIIELSNLVYWNAGHKKLDIPDLSSEMAFLILHNMNMVKEQIKVHKQLHYTKSPTHFFSIFQPQALESLFCGGIFFSLADTIQALKKDCSATYLKKANYANLIRKQNELFVRLNMLFQKSRADTAEGPKEEHISTGPSAPASKEQVLRDAEARREAYIKKVTKDGLKKLYMCLESQSSILTDTLCLRTWGAVVYEEASSLKNHFLFRKQFYSLAWTDNSLNCNVLYENSKYIKNSLYSHQLSKEYIDSLTLQFYQFLIGPLFIVPTLFPSPNNVVLAHCLDAAGVMPHQKNQLTELIWSTIEPKDWIDAEFNNFYNINALNLNDVQVKAWRYIRELVLSVALYNRVWEKHLTIYSVCTLTQNCLLKTAADFDSGLYLTYEVDSPLILIYQKNGWIFKDLYALLYHYLQLTSTP